MEKIEKIWVEFWDRYIDPALFQVQERPKTFEAMERFWDAVSQDELDQLPGLLVVFAPPPNNLGEAIRWWEQGIEREGYILYLAPSLERMAQSKVNSIVAHEFAHALLGHGNTHPRIESSEKLPPRQADYPYEIEADMLVEKWGFKPYGRSNKMGNQTS